MPEAARLEYERQNAVAKSFGMDRNSPQQTSRLGALILREDGWAMLRPKHESGKALTRQFVFEGTRLHLNAECGFGYLRVELLDPFFKPYEGFSAEDCEPVHGQGVWHTVSWKGRSDLRALWNKPVMACFHLYESSLYAFQFAA